MERLDLSQARRALQSLDQAAATAQLTRGDHVTIQGAVSLLSRVIEENAQLRQLLDQPTVEAEPAEVVEE